MSKAQTPDTHTVPTLKEIEQTITISNMELEKRMTKTLSDKLDQQHQTYMTEIIALNEKYGALNTKVNIHDERIKGFKGIIATITAVSSALGGLVGFFIAQLTIGR